MSNQYIKSGWRDLDFFQLKDGYKFSVDTVLLASFIKFKKNNKILELGSGEGVIPLFLSKRALPFYYTGIEIQRELADLSRKNIELFNIDGEIVFGDYKNIKKLIKANYFDVVIINPPYYKLGTGKTNPNNIEFVARHEISGSLDSSLAAANYALKNRGKLFLIYPAKRISSLFETVIKYNFQPKTIRFVYSSEKTDAKFVLAYLSKNGGEECKILQPLYIYDDPKTKKYTHEVESIFESLEMEY